MDTNGRQSAVINPSNVAAEKQFLRENKPMLVRLTLLAILQILLCADALNAQSLPHYRPIAPGQPFVKYDSHRPQFSPQDSLAPTRRHRAKVGAIAGAVSLGILGLLATSQAQTGCDLGESNCKSGQRKLALSAYGLALGGTAGAITGGLVGFSWPLPRTSRKP